jgi:hypothetical protein
MINRERLSEIEWQLCEREVQYVYNNGHRDNMATDDMTFLLHTIEELGSEFEAERDRLREALKDIADGELYPIQIARAALAEQEGK